MKKSKKIIDDFNHTIGIWIKELERYEFVHLCSKPSPHSWSLGQVYVHLIYDTKYYIEQIKTCVTTNDNATEEPSPDGKTMLSNNDFPDEALEGAPSNAHIPQPENKEQLLEELTNIQKEINDLAIKIAESSFHGKTKHPGLNYFGAMDWLQFADMHFRHHLRQKKRIDNYLKNIGYHIKH